MNYNIYGRHGSGWTPIINNCKPCCIPCCCVCCYQPPVPPYPTPSPLPPLPPPVIIEPVQGAVVFDGLIVAGAAEPGNTVHICIGSICVDTIADAGGYWEREFEGPFGEGVHPITVTQTDICGRTSGEASTFFVVPTANIPVFADNFSLNMRQIIVYPDSATPCPTNGIITISQEGRKSDIHVLSGIGNSVPYTNHVMLKRGTSTISINAKIPQYYTLIGISVSETEEENQRAPLEKTSAVNIDCVDPVWVTVYLTPDFY